jgi:hypothetical protein
MMEWKEEWKEMRTRREVMDTNGRLKQDTGSLSWLPEKGK